jgi:hypothetical protein
MEGRGAAIRTSLVVEPIGGSVTGGSCCATAQLLPTTVRRPAQTPSAFLLHPRQRLDEVQTFRRGVLPPSTEWWIMSTSLACSLMRRPARATPVTDRCRNPNRCGLVPTSSTHAGFLNLPPNPARPLLVMATFRCLRSRPAAVAKATRSGRERATEPTSRENRTAKTFLPRRAIVRLNPLRGGLMPENTQGVKAAFSRRSEIPVFF